MDGGDEYDDAEFERKQNQDAQFANEAVKNLASRVGARMNEPEEKSGGDDDAQFERHVDQRQMDEWKNAMKQRTKELKEEGTENAGGGGGKLKPDLLLHSAYPTLIKVQSSSLSYP